MRDGSRQFLFGHSAIHDPGDITATCLSVCTKGAQLTPLFKIIQQLDNSSCTARRHREGTKAISVGYVGYYV